MRKSLGCNVCFEARFLSYYQYIVMMTLDTEVGAGWWWVKKLVNVICEFKMGYFWKTPAPPPFLCRPSRSLRLRRWWFYISFPPALDKVWIINVLLGSEFGPAAGDGGTESFKIMVRFTVQGMFWNTLHRRTVCVCWCFFLVALK